MSKLKKVRSAAKILGLITLIGFTIIVLFTRNWALAIQGITIFFVTNLIVFYLSLLFDQY